MAGQVVYTKSPVTYTQDTLNSAVVTSGIGGTAVPLAATSTPCIEVAIQPLAGNLGVVWVGGASVASDGSQGGIRLAPPAAGTQPPVLNISAQNLAQVYINPVQNNEGVTILYW